MNKILSSRKVLVFAHRGASKYAPENTLSSFKLAQDMNADGVELDVHLSRDSQLIVMHDSNVSRTTNGHGQISKMNLGKIRKLDAGIKFDQHFRGEKVPILDEVVSTLDSKTLFNIEIKKYLRANGIVKRVVELIRRNKLQDRAIITSFSPLTLRKAKKIDEKICVGLTLLPFFRFAWLANFVPGLDAVSAHQSSISVRFVKKMHSRDIKVFAWTLNEKWAVKKMISYGVDAIITDAPDITK